MENGGMSEGNQEQQQGNEKMFHQNIQKSSVVKIRVEENNKEARWLREDCCNAKTAAKT